VRIDIEKFKRDQRLCRRKLLGRAGTRAQTYPTEVKKDKIKGRRKNGERTKQGDILHKMRQVNQKRREKKIGLGETSETRS